MIQPSGTYRIQFNPQFTFNHLAAILDYLNALGITTIYASPLLQPAKGSSHGYDGINPAALNPELGTEEDLENLAMKIREKGMSWIQDIVPNHLAFDTNNLWLKDVLERGINSPYANYFDIDWEHPFYHHKLMVPFLGASLQECLQKGEIRLAFQTEGFFICYYENHYPVNIETYPLLLSGCFGEEGNHVNASISALINNNNIEVDHWNNMKTALLNELQSGTDCINSRLNELNKDIPLLMQILSAQHYVLCHHIISHTQINYRRFFNVNGLICLCMEDEQVFYDYHRYTHGMYEKGYIQGLRIDHIDGLKNPRAYIDRLRSVFGKDCYIIVEKILDVKEELPGSFDIQGTSGYEFLSYINQLITDNRGSDKLLRFYQQLVPEFRDYDTIVFDNKLSNLDTYLNGEWDNLLRLLLSLNLVEDEEIKITNLKMALGVLMAAYPVYRAYIEDFPLEENDQRLVDMALEIAKERYPALRYELSVLYDLFKPHEDPIKTANRLTFVQRLMQFTGPLAAKGVEDTTFYRYNVLISHNEVGDEPCVLGIDIQTFHDKMQQRQRQNPMSFNCTSTHDTKRGEDNRIRINIISEMAEQWIALVKKWMERNDPLKKIAIGVKAPIVNDEYFIYQAIMGGFPEDLELTDEFRDRTKRYVIKALRESKFMSDHVEPNLDYEEACSAFIDQLLDPDQSFLSTMMPFVASILRYANIYTMVQVIIKTTAPGIPDIYQGCELWDLSYVDPDNRRPVNYKLRNELLHQLNEKEQQDPQELLHWANEHYLLGTQKMFVTKEILELRKQFPSLFIKGEYIPVYPVDRERNVIAFVRRLQEQWVLIVLPLAIAAQPEITAVIELPADAPVNWKNIFTGEILTGRKWEVKDLFRLFPVAVFQSQN
ncbi:MAG: malto-oligosyltrehalose synthase [Citrobacter freundii]|nr:MAG: malto-oligosyltrehalose synthase [Citrobacter freundii]